MQRKSILFVVLAAVLVGVQIGYGILVVCIFGRPEGPGAFGDMFGGFSCLLSGLGFVGVVLTLLQQIQSNREAAEDRESSDELQRQHIQQLEKQVSEYVNERKRDELKRTREKLEAVIYNILRMCGLARQIQEGKKQGVYGTPDAMNDPRISAYTLVRIYAPDLRPSFDAIASDYWVKIHQARNPTEETVQTFLTQAHAVIDKVGEKIDAINRQLSQ